MADPQSQSVPMIAPDGSIGDVPMERMQDAIHAGFQVGVSVKSPDGQTGVIPAHRYQEALKAGFSIDNSGKPTQFEQERDPANQQGFLSTAASDIAGMAKGAYQGVQQMVANTGHGLRSAQQRQDTLTSQADAASQADAQRKAAGYGLPYRAAAQIAPLAGANVQGMEQDADRGNTAGVLGHAAAPLAVAAAAEGVKAALPAGADVIQRLQTGNQANVMPEIGKLPPKVVNATENIFQAAAPTGMNKGFRANLYAAVPDLADIGRNLDLAEAKGGIINPDMRVRATVGAIRDHLNDMYQTERAPQIERNADLPVNFTRDPNVMRGLEYFAKTAGDVKDAALAQHVLEGGNLNVQDANQLAMAVNQSLTSFERLTPEGKAQVTTTNPKVGGLKALDGELGKGLNQTLTAQGEPGLTSYERRFAALSAIRDQLESRMNATELNTPGAFKKVIKPIASTFTGGTSGVASASQAAVSDVNIGRKLQIAFRDLGDSNLTSKSAVQAPAASPPQSYDPTEYVFHGTQRGVTGIDSSGRIIAKDGGHMWVTSDPEKAATYAKMGNGDGKVYAIRKSDIPDLEDYAVVDPSTGQPAAPGHWSNGDFDLPGRIFKDGVPVSGVVKARR